MYNFIHRKLVKDGSFPCIIQPNDDNLVLLAIEQSPYPGEENSRSGAAELPLATQSAWPPRLRPPRRREAAAAFASAAAAPALAAGPLPGNRREAAARPPCRARGPATAAAAPACLAGITAALYQKQSLL